MIGLATRSTCAGPVNIAMWNVCHAGSWSDVSLGDLPVDTSLPLCVQCGLGIHVILKVFRLKLLAHFQQPLLFYC